MNEDAWKALMHSLSAEQSEAVRMMLGDAYTAGTILRHALLKVAMAAGAGESIDRELINAFSIVENFQLLLQGFGDDVDCGRTGAPVAVPIGATVH